MKREEWKEEQFKRDQEKVRKYYETQHDKAVQRCLDSWKARGK